MLIIDDLELLNALLYALWTVKFDVPPEDSLEIAGSPLVAEVYSKAYEAAIEVARRNFNEAYAQNLEKSRSAEGKELLLAAVRRHIQISDKWSTWTREQKQRYVRILLSPYIAGDELVDSIIEGISISN